MESDSRPSPFSGFLTQRLIVVHWVEQSPSGDATYPHPSSTPVFPKVTFFVTRVLPLLIRAMMGVSVDVVSLCWHAVRS